jgi:hypothetical protein
MRTTASIIVFGACLGLARGVLAQDTGITDLEIQSADASNAVQTGSSLRGGGWGAPLSYGIVSSSSYSATGKGHLYGTLRTQDGVSDPNGSTGNEIWVTDLITLHAPAAGAQDRTPLTISAFLSGNSQTKDAQTFSSANLVLCLSGIGCDSEPQWVIDDASLPRDAVGIEGFNPIQLQGAGNLKYRASTTFFMVGQEAVFPLWAEVAQSGQIVQRVDLLTWSVTGTWKLQLPAGVTCTSRSGRAFDKQCPKDKTKG